MFGSLYGTPILNTPQCAGTSQSSHSTSDALLTPPRCSSWHAQHPGAPRCPWRPDRHPPRDGAPPPLLCSASLAWTDPLALIQVVALTYDHRVIDGREGASHLALANACQKCRSDLVLPQPSPSSSASRSLSRTPPPSPSTARKPVACSADPSPARPPLFHFRSLAVSIPTFHGRLSSPLPSPAFFSSGSKPRAIHCLYTMSSSATRAKTQSQPCAMTRDESGKLTSTASWNIAAIISQNGEKRLWEIPASFDDAQGDLRKPT